MQIMLKSAIYLQNEENRNKIILKEIKLQNILILY